MSYKKSVFRSLAMVTQLGLSVVTPIFLCIFAGYQIDTHYGTKLMLPLLILGTLAGGRCAWVLVVRILKADQQDDEQNKPMVHQGQSDSDFVKPKEPSRVRGVKSDEGKEMNKDGMA